jgi:hypothetical protein
VLGPRQEIGLLFAQEVTGDDQALDFAGALADGAELDVAVKLLRRMANYFRTPPANGRPDYPKLSPVASLALARSIYGYEGTGQFQLKLDVGGGRRGRRLEQMHSLQALRFESRPLCLDFVVLISFNAEFRVSIFVSVPDARFCFARDRFDRYFNAWKWVPGRVNNLNNQGWGTRTIGNRCLG